MSYVREVPEPGQLVEVRQRRYVVTDVVPSVLSTDALLLHRQHVISLSSVDDDALGEELQVLWEIEPGVRAIEKTPLPEPAGFDTPQRLDTLQKMGADLLDENGQSLKGELEQGDLFYKER